MKVAKLTQVLTLVAIQPITNEQEARAELSPELVKKMEEELLAEYRQTLAGNGAMVSGLELKVEIVDL